MADEYGSIQALPIQNKYWENIARILQWSREMARTLQKNELSPLWRGVGEIAEWGLGKAPETAENYAYGFPPRREAGPLGAVNPANFELAGLAPVGTAAKASLLTGKAALSALAPLAGLGGVIKGVGKTKMGQKYYTPVIELAQFLKDNPGAYTSGAATTSPEVFAKFGNQITGDELEEAAKLAATWVEKEAGWSSPAHYVSIPYGDPPKAWETLNPAMQFQFSPHWIDEANQAAKEYGAGLVETTPGEHLKGYYKPLPDYKPTMKPGWEYPPGHPLYEPAPAELPMPKELQAGSQFTPEELGGLHHDWEGTPEGFKLGPYEIKHQVGTGNWELFGPGGSMITDPESSQLKAYAEALMEDSNFAAAMSGPGDNVPGGGWSPLQNWDVLSQDKGDMGGGEQIISATHKTEGTTLVQKDEGWFLTKGGNAVGPHPTPEAAMKAYEKYLAVKKSKPTVPQEYTEPSAVGWNEEDPAIRLLEERHGISKQDIERMNRLEPMTPTQWLKRYDEAQSRGEDIFGLGPGNTIEDRRNWAQQNVGILESPTQEGEQEVLSRGSHRINPTPVAPMFAPPGSSRKTANTTANNFGHPLIFASGPEASYSGSYPHKETNLRAVGVAQKDLLRPDWVQENPRDPMTFQFEHTYDDLKEMEQKGLLGAPKEYYPGGDTGQAIFKKSGKEVMDAWRRLGWGAGFHSIESPDIVLTLQRMGLKGFTTYEAGGRNYAFFEPGSVLRHERAPWDLAKLKSPGYYRSLAPWVGLGGLAASFLNEREQQ